MPATNSTPHYDLPLYLPDDHFSVLGDLNGAMTTIDNEIAVIHDSTTSAAANAQAALTAATAAQSQAEAAATSAQAASVSAASARAASNSAIEKAGEAEATANEASETASGAQRLASDARGDAATALTRATTAVSTADGAVATANGIASTAESALSAATGAESAVAAVKTKSQTFRHKQLGSDLGLGTGYHDVIALTASTVSGYVYRVDFALALQIGSGVTGSKNVQIRLDGSTIQTLVINEDPYQTTITGSALFTATGSSHTVNIGVDSTASSTITALASGTHIYIS